MSSGASLRDRAFVPSGSSPQAVSPLRASIPSAVLLDEIVAHLGAAISQSLPSDDQIIMGHVRSAHEYALILKRANK